MALSAGFRLGPYEIVVPLSAGGMGDVQQSPVLCRQSPVAPRTGDLRLRLGTRDLGLGTWDW